MPPASHYQRLYNDIESGVGLSNPEERLDAHDSPSLLEKLYSLPSSLSTPLSSLLSHCCSLTKSSFQQVVHKRRPFVLALCLLLVTSAFLVAWLVLTDVVTRMLDESSFSGLGSSKSGPSSHYQLWPRPEDANGKYSTRYALIPFSPVASSFNVTPGPQSPPQNVPLDVLDVLFDPSSLSRNGSSGSRLPPNVEAFSKERTKFDIVWTWVNGSDPLHRQALAEAERSALVQRGALEKCSGMPFVEPTAAELDAAIIARTAVAPKLYRDHDELRYSLRSVLKHFGPHVNRFHVVAGDFADPSIPNARLSNNGTENGIAVRGEGNRASHGRSSLGSSVAEGSQTRSSAPAVIRRFGQIPQWLRDDVDVMSPKPVQDANAVSLKFHHHSQFFARYERLTFDSFAIEAQLSRIQGIAEHFIYMNDDYFFYDTVQPADFYTPAYGIVLRLQPDFLVTSANPSYEDKHGEWRPLQYSNWLLDERYGARARPYMVHAPKSMSLAVFRELSSFRNFVHKSPSGKPEEATMGGVFRDALLTTAKHTFRGQYSLVKNHDDAHVTFLFVHHVVERWREALLWSWVVGRVGGDNDEWTAELHRTKAWAELCGSTPEDSTNGLARKPYIQVGSNLRETLDRDTVVNVLGGESATTYSFSSLDGYPYAFLSRGGSSSWPQMTDKSQWLHGQPANSYRPKIQECRISLEICFSVTLNRASEVFKRVAFETPECGDCIIRQLVILSGKKGIEAFLPHVNRVAKFSFSESSQPLVDNDDDRDPFLPLGSSWEQIDFSPKSVLAPWAKELFNDTEAPTGEHEHRRGEKGSTVTPQSRQGSVNVREWVMRAMARYRFVLGETPFEFVMLRSPLLTASKLQGLSRKEPRPAMVCINDDLRVSRYTPASANRAFKQWMESTWGTKTRWER